MSKSIQCTALVLAGLVAGGLLIAAPAVADSASPSASTAPLVLRIGMTTGIDNPNLWAVNSPAEWGSLILQYDLALQFSPDLAAQPSVADSCDPSADFKTWTCKIHPGIKWSDGQPLTSKDVAFSYRFAIDKQFDYFSSYFPKGTTFETPDDLTLIWHSPVATRGPKVPAWAYIVPEHIWGKYANDDIDKIKAVNTVPNVASGPFIMTSATPGQNWTFTRNPYFWGNKPVYDQIVFQLYTNQEAMVQALKNGQIDIGDGFDGALLPALGAIKNVKVQKVTSDFWVNMAFNFGNQDTPSKPLAALKDIKVRKAIELAIDKQAIVDKVYPQAASPGETIVRPLSDYWHLDIPSDKVLGYDPAAANALLDEAGYPMGTDGVRIDPKNSNSPLRLRLPVSDDVNGSTSIGQLIEGFLKKVGIAVEVKPVTAAKMYDLQQAGDFDAYVWYWTGDPDPNYQLSVFTSDACLGDGHLSDGCWKDATYDSMFAKQTAEMNPEARLKIVQDMQQYVYDQVPVIVLAYPNYIEAYRTDQVAGLVPTPVKDGYLTTSYGYASMVSAHPAQQDAAPASTSSSGIPPWAMGLIGLVLVIGGWLVWRRFGKRGDDEFERD